MSSPPAQDVFSQLFDLLRSEKVLADPRATGEGVRVCVVDTGIDRQRLAERARARGQEVLPVEGAVFREDRVEPVPDDGKASSPHGTTVADILLGVAPRARLFSADIFGPAGSSDARVLIRAIRWGMDVCRCKVINLSLGIPEPRLQLLARRQELQRTVEEAYFRDVLIVAAANNDHPVTRSYPAVFSPPLVSVDKGTFDDPLAFGYRLNEQIEFVGHGPGPLGSQPMTSWATAHLSGLAVRLLSLRPELKPFEIKTLLYWMARKG